MRRYLARFASGGLADAVRRARRGRLVLFALAPVLVAGLVVVLLPGGHRSTPRRASTPAQAAAVLPGVLPAAKAAVAEQSKPTPVTLVTGNRVVLTPAPGGRSVVTAQPAPGGHVTRADSFAYTFRAGADVYSIPGNALPYLGSRLDPRFFDVSYLQRAGYAKLSALPVSISWRSGTHSAIPGITTPSTGTTTSGSVNLATASTFGHSLASRGALAQVKKIALGDLPAAAGPVRGAEPSSVAPAVPMSSSSAPTGTKLYSLAVQAVDAGGKPSSAVVAIQNLKTLTRYYSVSAVGPDGQLAVSVPAGPYGVDAIVYDNAEGNIAENVAFVSLPEVDVTHDTAVTLDSRQAEPIDISVPKPAAPEIAMMTFSRVSADGNGLEAGVYTLGPGISSALLPPVHLYAKPTSAPRLGSLGFADSWELVPVDSGLQGVDAPYAYSLDFASDDGVPAVLSHTLTQGDLATVRDSYAASVPGATAQSLAVPFHHWSTLAVGLFPAVFDYPVPTERDDYFGGSAATVWSQASQLTVRSQFTPPAIFGPYRTYQPGDDVSVTWGASPSVPAPEWQSTGIRAGSMPRNGVGRRTWSYVCPVCRQGDVMAFNVPVSGDNDPTHSEDWFGMGSGVLAGPAGDPSDSVKFYRNGVLTQLGDRSGQMFPMLPGKASYTIDWASTIPTGWTQLATSVRSVWTFRSTRPTRADRLPSYELCAPDSNHECSFLPLVFASYDFGANLNGQVSAPGTETFTLTGYHEAGDNAPAVADASVQVSFDDGATWAPASSVTPLGGGRFRVAVNQQATSGYASFKVSLADGAGNTLQQTILRAYSLTPGTSR